MSRSVPAPRLAAARYSWRKLSAAKWGDSWLERLSFLGPQRVMVIELAGARTARVEAHGLTKAEGERLLHMFGGKLSESKWLTAVDPPQRPPIRVRGKLLVVSTERERETHARSGSKIPAILIPAGMAFGTGEHATTATCLRLLVDVAKARRLEGAISLKASQKIATSTASESKKSPALRAGRNAAKGKKTAEDWEMLDLGTGSGILAITGRLLGASRVLAGDFDSFAVRTARENIRDNGIDRVTVQRLDVSQWTPDRTWPLISANLYSGLLLEIAPKLAKALAPGGKLVFSGLLREQEAEVVAAFRKAGLAVEKMVRKGKWASGIAARAARKFTR